MPRLIQRFHPEGIPAPATRLYNRLSRTRPFQKHYELVAEDLAGYVSRGRVLDVGTGPGWLLEKIHQRLPDIELTGVDVSPAMVEKARGNMALADLADRVRIEPCEPGRMPFGDETFDLVVSTGSIHHWKHPVEQLDDLHRVLKPGGHALVYDLIRDTPWEMTRAAARQFGRFKMLLFWVHTFEEPFLSQGEMADLARRTRFGSGRLGLVGLFCRLEMKKEA